MKIKLNINFWWIVLSGSLWGLIEASLGFLLHQLSMSSIAGHVMMPIGFSLLLLCYRKSRVVWGMPVMAVIAAQVKLINLFMGAPAPAVVNPVFSILAMGFLLMGFKTIAKKRSFTSVLPVVAVMSLSWSLLHQVWAWVAKFIMNSSSIVDLWGVFHGKIFLMNSLIAFILFSLAFGITEGLHRKFKGYFRFSPVIPGILVYISAVSVSALINLL